jgi:serine/threonine protein kinase
MAQTPNYVGDVASVPPQISGLRDWRALARGGFATVWAARQESLNRLVAVKVDQRTLDSDSEQRRFLREAGAAGRMSGHPGIVTVHDAGILTDNRPYLVMELCDGGSLTKWVRAKERPTAEQVREVGVRIADALAAAHARGVLHRDVKPANILIDSYGHAGLADFGLAALPDPGNELSDTLEAITPAYAPPEAFHRQPPTEVGDVYSLGATLYALLAGHPPRWPETGSLTITEMLQRHEEPIERIAGIDDGLMDALLAAMATDPADRPTAARFRDLLNEVNLAPPPPHARRAVTPANGAATDSDTSTTELDRSTRRKAPAGVAGASARPGSARAGPEQESWPEGGGPKPDQRARRGRIGIVIAAAVVLASAVALSLISLLPRQVVGEPPVGSPTATASSGGSPASELSASPSPARTRTQTPKVAMPPEPECWGGVHNYADSPLIGIRADCNETHLYQTFAVGALNSVPLRQSKLEALPQVKKVCKARVVNRMLDEADRRPDWDIEALYPQEDGEMFYRCIFGRGQRVGAYKLKPR